MGARRGGAPKGWGPKISRFFSLSHRKFHTFFSLWGFSRGILVVFEAPGLKCARLEFSGCRAKPRRPGGLAKCGHDPCGA